MARRNHNGSARGSARRMGSLLVGTAMAGCMFASSAFAQDAAAGSDDDGGEAIVVTGIRSSLQSALGEKRNADNLVEVIQAEDIGKLPDQNLAEVLENVTGIQITRQAGVGNSVQIRGTDANRVEINGVSTVGSGSGRSGISFEDLPASLISSVEVVKVPEAKTIEGSVGGTINLRTIRPLSLREPLVAARAQWERSDLAQSTLPRLSATVGNRFDTGIGEIGIVLSGSYARQDVAQFAPRVDLDNLRKASTAPNLPGSNANQPFDYLQVQFLQQETNNYEYETYNGTAGLEWKPTDSLKLYFDATLNNQQRSQESNRVQVSGTSNAVNTAFHEGFQTIDLGTLIGPNGPIDLGTVEATTHGTIGVVGASGGTLDPNLRMSSDTGSRVTKSRVYDVGTEWEGEKLRVRAELSLSTSNTVNPNFSTTLDFINPRSVQPVFGRGTLDNGSPVRFDLRDNVVQSGIDTSSPFAPTTDDLLNPANYQLNQVAQGASTARNKERAARLDFTYDTLDLNPIVPSIDFGYRWNETTAINNDISNNISLTSNSTGSAGRFNRPEGNLFSDILIKAPSNFNAADGRELYFSDFLIIDGGLSFRDPGAVLDALNAAITASNTANPQFPAVPLLSGPTESAAGFFSVKERTNALYFQANLDLEPIGIPARGNIGVRWLTTTLSSTGNNISNGVAAGQTTSTAKYSFLLPRFNLVLEPARNVLLRGGIARDIRRPNFDDLSTSRSYSTSAEAIVQGGNPNLVPESVYSFDLSGEWYFAPSSLLSLGFFHKIRSNLFSPIVDFPTPIGFVNGNPQYSIDPACPGGGVFNPLANRNINSQTPGNGICAPLGSTFNVAGTTTQTGVEAAFQYDLSQFEDALGFASGFGFIGNFTYQKPGGSAETFYTGLTTRNLDTGLGFPAGSVQSKVTLTRLSKYAYNTTLFYDKYGLNARLRYTWRSSYITTEQFRWNLPVIADARGQLNASINYDVTPNINIGVEGINLLRGDQRLYCVNNNAVLCFQGLTDRRITAGLSIKL
ncbi:Colicin I receptor precursor [Tsuneonella dongtanensis]|uniref:Colicin I receptor n=1 Tax=Tsuneonella dongtanensis TaxID=692370 RepID=A0A1B2ADJ4_9SPHN|nr:TonB-dependent receptor [Tsuneonella dongtanensis]ANY20230.1 Colicin I receptor precursor [Tsuneonella dongtanensis]